MPTATKPKPDEIYVCIESFAGNEFAVAEGTVLPGEDERVQRCPELFVAVGTPDEEIRRLKTAAAVPPPPPKSLGRVKLRVLPGQGGLSALDGGRPQTVFANGREYVSGDTLEAEGADAQYLIDGGFCEIVESLPKKLAKAGQASNRTDGGLMAGSTNVQKTKTDYRKPTKQTPPVQPTATPPRPTGKGPSPKSKGGG